MTNKKCPCDTTITENIALVAAVSSATAIAGGKYFKMPGVLAAKYLRMFTSASLAALGGESSATTAKWNGKSSASSFSTCDAYNTGREHQGPPPPARRHLPLQARVRQVGLGQGACGQMPAGSLSHCLL
jgi:hypothetical protein